MKLLLPICRIGLRRRVRRRRRVPKMRRWRWRPAVTRSAAGAAIGAAVAAILLRVRRRILDVGSTKKA